MSIINEALKKTEQHIQKNAAKVALANQLPDKKTKSKKIFLYLLILLCGIILSNFIFSFLNNRVKTTLPENKTAPLAQQPVIAVAPLPIAQVVNPPEEKKPVEVNFVLNGIFYSDNNGYALVNNQIVRELDSVDGAKVNKITENSVELDNQGKIITLVTQR